MKTFYVSLIVLLSNVSILLAAPEIYTGEDLNYSDVFGGSDVPVRLENYPHALSAHNQFMSRIIDANVENYESFSANEVPDILHFGTNTAVFSGQPYILEQPIWDIEWCISNFR